MPRGTPFQPGNKAAQNRGANKITKGVKDTFLQVFNDLQEDPKTDLTSFAKKYPRDFYNLATKLIPTEISGQITQNVIKVVRADRGNNDNTTDTPS